ncbi:O-antigen polymerase [Qipengyuania flava]|uniref:O-antigen polymerase n=1 Tax=Qipengyuania flava TaxID=192812 RepID=UPI001C62739C|nr:O-antigen polymerase [Qipengyuania flava]QYJ06262.1 oligosaccharide repeat unit polymerase [Qipengyuania flava]
MPLYDIVLGGSTFAFLALLAIYLRHPAASIFNPATVYLAFHGLVFVIRPLFARVYDFRSIYASIGFTPSLDTKVTTLLAANLGLFVMVGLCMVLCPPLEFRQSTAERQGRASMMVRYLPAFAVLSGLCLWALIWLWGFKSTGLAINEMDTRTGGQGLVAASGYFISLTGFLVSLGALFAYLNRFRWWSFIPFALFAVLRLGIGGRGEVVVACFVLALLFLVDRRSRWPNLWIVAGLVPLYLAFSAVVADRGAGVREALTGEAQPEIVYYSEADLAPLEHMDFGNLEFFEYVVHVVPERSGTYDYFLHNLQILTEPIPRGLWKDKPYGAPIKPVDLYNYGKPIGMTMSLPGVGWFSLGYVGVVLWSAFFALIYCAAYRAFASSRQTVLATVTYALFLGTSIIAFRDGMIITILKQGLFFAIPVVALWLSERLLRPRSGPESLPLPARAMPGQGMTAPAAPTPAERRAALARQVPTPEG